MENKKSNRLFKILIVYIVFLYPFICNLYQIYGGIETINRSIVFLLIFLYMLKNTNTGFVIHVNQEQKLVLLTIVYLFISLLFCTLIYNYSFSFLFKEFFYSILPLILYLFIKTEDNQQERFVGKTIVASSLLSILIGIALLARLDNGFLTFLSYFGDENKYFKLNGIYGGIVCAYLYQLSFTILLFKKNKNVLETVLMFIFAVATFLTGQRMGVVGLLLGLIVYLFFNRDKNGRNNFSNNLITLTCLLLVGLVSVLILNQTGILKFDLFDRLNQILFHKFSIVEITSRANDQRIITDKNIFTFFFGEGFGKYSYTNESATLVQSDACYYRIINELGIIGFCVFFAPILLFLYKSIKKRDEFAIYFIVELLVAFFFNRILWSPPVGFFFFIIMALKNTDSINYGSLVNEGEMYNGRF